MRRRQFLRLAAGVTGGYTIGLLAPRAGASQLVGGGEMTKARGSLRLGSHMVAPGQTLRFDPNHDTTMELTGNLVVEGTLEMRPNPGVTHILRFVGIDESRFVGGGMDVLDSDVGLWVMGRGQLDIEGEPRAGWNRTGTDDTWKSGHAILTTPFAPGDSTTFAPYAGSLATVTAPDGRVFTQEAFNLTRSVRIEGTPQGRAHIFIHSTAPQNIRYAAIRHVGPRTPVGGQEISTSVLGRYGLHFHMCEEGSRGSTVTGVVVRDCGGHAFAPHHSHGVTFRDCVAYNGNEDAFWWDSGQDMASNDVLYDHCLAAGLVPIPSFRGYTLTGFLLGAGKNNAAVGCVGVGSQGNRNGSGFSWQTVGSGSWVFKDCIAHNNKADGIFVWQNNRDDHLIQEFVGFRNAAGIFHGAYSNNYRYERILTFENETGLIVNAVSSSPPHPRLRWDACEFADGVRVSGHNRKEADQAALIVDCVVPWIVVDEKNGSGAYDFIRCDLQPGDWTVTSMQPGSVYRVQNADGSAYQVKPDGTTPFIPQFA